MAAIVLFILTIALNARTYLSQDTEELEYNKVISKAEKKGAEDTVELKSENEPLIQLPPMETLCYVGHMKCASNIYPKDIKENQICAYQVSHGLVNFQSACEIALQNCLYKAEQIKAGKKSDEPFFYNGKDKPCQYYLEKGVTLENAVKLYYIDGVDFGKFSEEFEKVDKNNEYDFIDLVLS